MKLYIDTSSSQKTIVKLGDQELVRDSDIWKSQAVLPMIEELLKSKPFSKITEIEINHGPGSFTGLRVGAAIAQALGFALKLPVDTTLSYSV